MYYSGWDYDTQFNNTKHKNNKWDTQQCNSEKQGAYSQHFIFFVT
jgi:hypothetical protein